MGHQTEFVLRNDGFWYAPPMDAAEQLDFTLDFGKHLGSDTIETLVSVLASGVWVALTAHDNDHVTIWLKDGVVRTTATVTVTIQTVGGRTIVRTFKVEIAKQ